jgi:hypothetical protein
VYRRARAEVHHQAEVYRRARAEVHHQAEVYRLVILTAIDDRITR